MMRNHQTILTFADCKTGMTGAHYVNVYPARCSGKSAGSTYGEIFRKPRRKWRRDDAADDLLRLPALSRYDLFRDEVRIALADQAIDPGGETGLAPGVYAAILQAASQSTLRRMADGLAGPLDATRIDRLRMLGNGVVPLQAAHAIRTLGVTLAGRTGNDPARFVWGCA